MSSERRRALLTGLTGQDGSFLAEILLAQGHEVIGLVRPETNGLGSAEHLRDKVQRVAGDLLSRDSLTDAVRRLRPDELYHLAAPTFVPDSWQRPAQTVAAISGATAALLEAVAEHSPSTRVLVAGSAEMYGDASESPQHESTPCRPRTPYAVAKLAAHQLVGLIRDQTGIFACSAILYNHESERRPERFVSRKVTRAAAAIKLGLSDELSIGDISAVRDWSFAGDIMAGCQLMLAHDRPRDCILASGVPHTVDDLVQAAFAHVGLAPDDYLSIDQTLVRGPERIAPIGDPGRARSELGWTPTLDFEQLIARMVDADLRELEEGRRT